MNRSRNSRASCPVVSSAADMLCVRRHALRTSLLAALLQPTMLCRAVRGWTAMKYFGRCKINDTATRQRAITLATGGSQGAFGF